MVSRYRWLLHKAVEDHFHGFFTFSVGDENFEQVVVCRNVAILRRIQSKECTHEKALIWASSKLGNVAREEVGPPHKIAKMKTAQDLTPKASKQVLQSTMNSQGKGTSRRPDIQLYVPRARRSIKNPSDSPPTPPVSTSTTSQDKKLGKKKLNADLSFKEKISIVKTDANRVNDPCEVNRTCELTKEHNIYPNLILNTNSVSADIMPECPNLGLLNISNAVDICNKMLPPESQVEFHNSEVSERIVNITESCPSITNVKTESKTVQDNLVTDLCTVTNQLESDSINSFAPMDILSSRKFSNHEAISECNSKSSFTNSVDEMNIENVIMTEDSSLVFETTSGGVSTLESIGMSDEGNKLPLSDEGNKLPLSDEGNKLPLSDEGDKLPLSYEGDKPPLSDEGDKLHVSSSGVGDFGTSGQNPSRRESDCITGNSSSVEMEKIQIQMGTTVDDQKTKTECTKKLTTKQGKPRNIIIKQVAQRTQLNEGDNWDALFDENGDSLHPSVKEGLSAALGKNMEIQKAKIDYLSFQPLEADLSEETYDHILELYDFPADFKTQNLLMAFSAFKDRGFDIKWVDDTHALAIFSSPVAAAQALEVQIPFIKVRPVSQATGKSKTVVTKQLDYLLPARPRPETSASLARRMITGALGMRSQVSKEQRESERRRLHDAKEKKKQVAKQKQDIWNGTVS